MLKFIKFVVVFAIIVPVVGLGPTLSAQDQTTCAALIDDMLTNVERACDGLAPGQACLAAGADMLSLADVDTIQTAALDPEQGVWDAALLQVATGHNDSPVKMALFGNAEIADQVDLPDELPTLEFTNSADYNINLREAPGTDYPVVGSLLAGDSSVADGKNEAGDWIRIATETGYAWLYAPLLELEDGALDALVVLDDRFNMPMQAFTLSTAADSSPCGLGSVGLLLQFSGENNAYLQVNGVDLVMDQATLLLQASDAGLMVVVLDGEVSLNGDVAETGMSVLVDADAMSVAQGDYRFAMLEDLPYGLVMDDLACTVGVTDTLASFRLPNGDPAEDLEVDAHYRVTGQAEVDEVAWWQIRTGRTRSWVSQADVLTAGACDDVETVSPTAQVSTGGTSGGGGAATGTGSALVPAGRSIWQAVPGADNMSGTCNSAPVVLCDHLVAITPSGSSIQWRGQEPQPYTLYSTGGDTYSYSGRNQLGNANLTMTLTFTSPNSWTMTMTEVFDADPQCTHTFYYSASFLR